MWKTNVHVKIANVEEKITFNNNLKNVNYKMWSLKTKIVLNL